MSPQRLIFESAVEQIVSPDSCDAYLSAPAWQAESATRIPEDGDPPRRMSFTARLHAADQPIGVM